MFENDRINPVFPTRDIPAWVGQMDGLAAARRPFLFILDFLLESPMVIPFDALPETGIRTSLVPDAIGHPASSATAPLKFRRRPVSFDEYGAGFDAVMQAIRAGDTYLLNLCYRTPVDGISDLESLYDRARAPFKLLVPGRFVVFSPETFVRIDGDRISTFPMKGTIDAALPDAASRLLGDLKEQEEHATVVDLLRNDLSMVAREVRVDRYRYLTEVQTSEKKLLQCSSEISGRIRPGLAGRMGSILYALLPAGSVTGAPKKRTVELIRAIEPEPRGYFTGVFGVSDGITLTSAVIIRMIEQRADGFSYRSGGGITYRSDARQEYDELVDKVYLPGRGPDTAGEVAGE